MNELRLYDRLKDSYDKTTQKVNYFKEVIESIKWDNVFTADGETYYTLGKFMLTVENINPFLENWKPTIMFSDRSMKEF